MLGASPLASASAGGGATVALLGIGVAAVALFDYTDDGRAAASARRTVPLRR
ncbi:hypothetical protein ACH4F6_08740 [Streptomyces sp. NPDC017936]|uniref:hypothetical protein n=1 Tax=Streptomyces sp. NPDC017936 TaxID=3365016 RepID=UPI00378B2AD9